MTSKKFKMALLGIGNMGRNHFRIINESDEFDLVAVVDPLVAQLPQKVPGNVPLLRTVEELADIDFDCAIVATPTQTHYQAVEKLLAMGKHLLVEKPVASTLEQAELLKSKAENLGLKLAVGNVERCNPAVTYLKRVVDAGLIGTPVHVTGARAGRFPGQVKEGNHVILDLAVHELDVVRLLLGPVTVTTSICHITSLEGIFDTAEILVKSRDGITASVHVNWLSPQRIRNLRVTGTKGVCDIDYINQACTVYGLDLKTHVPVAWQDYHFDESFTFCQKLCFDIEKCESLRVQLAQFYNYLTDQPHILCQGEEVTESLWMIEQCVNKSQGGLTPALIEGITRFRPGNITCTI